MCGVFGLYSPDRPVTQARLKSATDALYHRGPDGEGFWISPDARMGLGHRRLSIIDLSTGGQPLLNARGDIAAVVNGEFYDHRRIRAELEAKGHRFKTRSDSEILLYLYEEHGTDCLKYLRGEFAFILWDGRKKLIFAARDRFGIKPLCHAQDAGGALYLASEAKAIFAAGFGAAWDHDAFFHACAAQYTPVDRTLFAGVRQVPPGHFLIRDGKGLVLHKYWDIDYPPEPISALKSDAEWLELFESMFADAVRLRLQADVPVCAHLSGGLDSSAIAAYAARTQGRPLDCFTVSFGEEGYDELPVAREMAEKLGASLHVVRVSQDDIVRAIPEAVAYSEGLSINGHLAGKFMLNRAIRAAGFKVALSGEGADELLAGYPHLREDLILTDGGEKERLAKLYGSNDKLAGVFLQHGDALPTDSVARALGHTPSFLRAKASLGLRVTSLLSKDYLAAMGARDVYREIVEAFDVKGQLAGRHPVNQSSYLWTKLALAGYILRTLGDGCEMAHAVEGRVPFLDHVLFEKMRALPLRMKIRDLTEKFILREAARPLLTETVYRRQKHPFIAPPVSRFSNPALDGFIQDTLRSEAFRAMPFFDSGKVIAWLDDLPQKSAQDRVAAEPVLMMTLSSFLIHKGFSL
jgi:asparagine synthase (glutamine-hydrolysing)